MSTHSRRQPALLLTMLLGLALLAPFFLHAAPASAALGADSGHDTGRRAEHEPKDARKNGQSLVIRVLPPIRQPGPAEAASTQAWTVVNGTLEPSTAGRDVELQQRVKGGWKTVTHDDSDSRGRLEFYVAPGGSRTFRAIAEPTRRLPALRSKPATGTWGAPDFLDEFDGPTLGPAWEHRIQFYNPWGGRACSKGDPSAVAVSDGTLHLSSMVDPARSDLCAATGQDGQALGSYPYRLNGHVSTQHSADFLYGVAAARMRFPRSMGQHAAFWLQPRGLLEEGTTPWGAEIDVIEGYGSSGKQAVFGSAVHEPMPDGSKKQIGGRIPDPNRWLVSRSDSWWTQFHVFSVEWTPEEYIFRISGHEVWRTSQGVSHDPEFLILSMLSSDYELPAAGTDPTPRTADVDWVAFWQAS